MLFELIIVNDGSRVFEHPRNFGLGQALKTGFAQCRGAVVYNFLIVVRTVILEFPGLRRAGAALREQVLPA